jgi:hypothetical protein
MNRFAPPTAPVSVPFERSRVPLYLRFAIPVLLCLLWWFDFPRSIISAFIGSHFPWPSAKAFRWPALFIERTLIETAVCLPACALLIMCFGRKGVLFTLPLAAIVGYNLFAEVALASESSKQLFLVFVLTVHVVLLLSFAFVFARLAQGEHAAVVTHRVP